MKIQAKRAVAIADRLEEIEEELEGLQAEKVRLEDELYDLDNDGGDVMRREAARIMEAW